MRILLAGLGIVAVMIGGFAYRGLAAEMPGMDAPWSEKVAFWEKEIAARGGSDAYDFFADKIDEYSYDDAHAAAHSFGSALFAAEGIRGITVCDSRFAFGCFHQFLGDAIHAGGLESVPNLNDACMGVLTRSPLSCQHGIGHGIVSYLGYEDDTLRRALDICSALPGTDVIGGCYGGVFMEYNVRTMLADAAEVRPYHDDPFDACRTLDATFLPACVYWLPQWWLQTALYGLEGNEQFRMMGDFCRSFAKTATLSRACFEGIGNIVTQVAGFEPARARTLCGAVSADAPHVLQCLSIGANHFGVDVGPAAAESMCETLEGDSRSYCLAYARNQSNVVDPGELVP